MELKFKALHPKIGREIPLPQFATPGSAAMDLQACIDRPVTLAPGGRAVIPTGLAMALPSADYVALLFARSGLGVKRACAFPTASASSTATTGEKSPWVL